MKLDWMMSWVMLATIGLGGCAATTTTDPADTTPAEAEAEPVELHRDGRFIVSGQPSAADLRLVAKEGVATVVTCRSVSEMEALDFDQAALAGELGMRYVHVPMGRDHGYEPSQIAAFTEAIESADGPIYVHCASGGRARALIMGHLIRHEGMSFDEAFAATERLGGDRLSFERLLGEKVSFELTGESLPQGDD
ncbi:MAG: sulfur transferase domain-containing protein [Planctomycetota bacterium]